MSPKIIISLVLLLIGLYLIVDGVGSIYYYYSSQPWIPDHIFRVFRIFVGLTVGYIGFRLFR